MLPSHSFDLIVVLFVCIWMLQQAWHMLWLFAVKTDGLCLSSTVLYQLLAAIGILKKDARLLTIFFVVYNVDCVINLLVLSTILQFARFMLQVIIIHLAGQLRNSLQSTWFHSMYIPNWMSNVALDWRCHCKYDTLLPGRHAHSVQ